MRRRVDLVVVMAALLLPACVSLGAKSTPTLKDDLEEVQQNLDLLPPFPVPAPASGSLWTDGGPGAALVRDTRAFRVNDMVTVRVLEASTGSNESTTDLKRSGKASYGAPIVGGLERPGAAAGTFNLADVLETDSKSDFAGDGKTTRGN
ncbi:MAG TPA: flagellar basal body L-ring protein FlgH, partial [Candidatus Polarisedimenticolia bacterium]|nr:flagellar basal body L-ring protein FlgH [Candidatus Polarisedimenticolia bacterium]